MQKQTQNDQKNLRDLIIEFLNMLNDGNTVTLHELNQNHKEISKYIYKFEIFDDFAKYLVTLLQNNLDTQENKIILIPAPMFFLKKLWR